VTTKLHTVHVRINDAATGQPTPARVRFTDAEGVYYAPLGRLTDFATDRNQDVGGNVRLGMKPWAYVEGSFEINLPPGTVHVEIHKGLEYRPLVQSVQLTPGKLALRFTLERWADMPSQGWYSGDGRVHSLSPHAALLEAQAEDVHVVNLLAASTEVGGAGGKKPAIPSILAFSGQAPALAAPGHIVVVNTHNSHPVLGSLGLLNCHRAVYPLTFGGPDGTDDWTLADWCDQCHRKNGLVVWTHTAREDAEFGVGEPLIDLVLGKVDAFEIDHFEDSPFDALPLWYNVLDAGIRVPLIGSSGKESNASALGVMRTYARYQAGKTLEYKPWIEAVRAGRTFVTNGPLLHFTANDQDPGDVLEINKSRTPVHVRAEVYSQAPFDSLQILLNGQTVAATSKETLELDLPIAEGGWLAARCRGTHQIFDRPANQRLFAHTSPIYLRIDDVLSWASRAAIDKLLVQIGRLENWVKHRANCSTENERQRLLALVSAGRNFLIASGASI
jgi:hypothetical protein